MIEDIDELILSFKNVFPNSSGAIQDNGPKLKHELEKFLALMENNGAFLHLKNWQKDKCIYQHIADFSEGVTSFEQKIVS